MRRQRRSRERSPPGMTRRRILLVLAAGSLFGATASATSAFSSVRTPRNSEVTSAADEFGILSFVGLSDPGQAPTFTNNSTVPMSITLDSLDDIEFDVGDNGNWVSPPVTFTLGSGSSETVNIRGSVSVATVSIAANLLNGLETVGAINMTRQFQIPEAGAVKEIVGTFVSAGSSGQYEFDLENIGENDVTVVAIGVNATTNPEAIVVDAGDILSVDGTQVMSTPIPVDSTNPSSDTRVEFDQHVSLNSGQTRRFKFNKFQRNDSPPNADMRGQDVKITLYFSDGSDLTINLCINGCDF